MTTTPNFIQKHLICTFNKVKAARKVKISLFQRVTLILTCKTWHYPASSCSQKGTTSHLYCWTFSSCFSSCLNSCINSEGCTHRCQFHRTDTQRPKRCHPSIWWSLSEMNKLWLLGPQQGEMIYLKKQQWVKLLWGHYFEWWTQWILTWISQLGVRKQSKKKLFEWLPHTH